METDIRLEIDRLTMRYQEEMISENQKDSLTRSYWKADKIRDEIKNLERQLKELTTMKGIYNMSGDRIEYLQELAQEYGIRCGTVFAIAEVLGVDEDYDRLISALEDYQNPFVSSPIWKF